MVKCCYVCKHYREWVICGIDEGVSCEKKAGYDNLKSFPFKKGCQHFEQETRGGGISGNKPMPRVREVEAESWLV